MKKILCTFLITMLTLTVSAQNDNIQRPPKKTVQQAPPQRTQPAKPAKHLTQQPTASHAQPVDSAKKNIQQTPSTQTLPAKSDVVADDQTIFQVVEEQPEFPGGMAELMKFLSKSIKYPTISQENGVQGRVIVQFVVNRDGSIVDPVVARSVDPYLDKEAIRVVTSMPKWRPGKQRGMTVRCRFTVPVTFRLPPVTD